MSGLFSFFFHRSGSKQQETAGSNDNAPDDSQPRSPNCRRQRCDELTSDEEMSREHGPNKRIKVDRSEGTMGQLKAKIQALEEEKRQLCLENRTKQEKIRQLKEQIALQSFSYDLTDPHIPFSELKETEKSAFREAVTMLRMEHRYFRNDAARLEELLTAFPRIAKTRSPLSGLSLLENILLVCPTDDDTGLRRLVIQANPDVLLWPSHFDINTRGCGVCRWNIVTDLTETPPRIINFVIHGFRTNNSHEFASWLYEHYRFIFEKSIGTPYPAHFLLPLKASPDTVRKFYLGHPEALKDKSGFHVDYHANLARNGTAVSALAHRIAYETEDQGCASFEAYEDVLQSMIESTPNGLEMFESTDPIVTDICAQIYDTRDQNLDWEDDFRPYLADAAKLAQILIGLCPGLVHAAGISDRSMWYVACDRVCVTPEVFLLLKKMLEILNLEDLGEYLSDRTSEQTSSVRRLHDLVHRRRESISDTQQLAKALWTHEIGEPFCKFASDRLKKLEERYEQEVETLKNRVVMREVARMRAERGD